LQMWLAYAQGLSVDSAAVQALTEACEASQAWQDKAQHAIQVPPTPGPAAGQITISKAKVRGGYVCRWCGWLTAGEGTSVDDVYLCHAWKLLATLLHLGPSIGRWGRDTCMPCTHWMAVVWSCIMTGSSARRRVVALLITPPEAPRFRHQPPPTLQGSCCSRWHSVL
jgi:hypothetical protein